MANDTTVITTIKSYIEILQSNGLKKMIYSISDIKNEQAEFIFNLPDLNESLANDNNLTYTWHVYHNFVYDVEEVTSVDGKIQFRKTEPLDQRESVYELIGEDGTNIVIQCHVKSKDLAEIIDSYQTEYSNKLAHVDLLIKNERKLNAEIQSRDASLKELERTVSKKDEELQQLTTEHEEELQQLTTEHEEELQQIIDKQNQDYTQYIKPELDRLHVIENSKTWKVAYGVTDGTKRLLHLKKEDDDASNTHPANAESKLESANTFIHHINKNTINKELRYVKEEGPIKGTKHLFSDYREGQEARKQHESVNITLLDIPHGKHLKITDFKPFKFKQYEHPTVSIVIPVYNQFAYTYNCLRSIRKYSGKVKYEIIIADDCSNDLTKEIKKVISGITVVRNEKNLLFLRNCNNAAKSAKGDYILFLNNDTQVQENWLQPLIDLMKKDEKIGMTGSKLIYSDGTLQESGGILWKDGSAWNYGRNQDATRSEYNYVKEVDYISGAAIMIRSALWKRLGGFDDRFAPAYYEDTDLAFQVREAGYKVVYQPLSIVVHFEGKSNGTDTSKGLKSYQVANSKKFYQKWKSVLQKENFPNGQNVFLARDRSRNKKHILVIDHYVPRPDQDAGGRCTFMYLEQFVKMGMQVTFIGDNFAHEEPYTENLRKLGIEVLYGDDYYLHWEKWLEENGKYFDYCYPQRPHIAIKWIDYLKKYCPQAKIFYFAHDLHHLREYREYKLTGDESHLEESKKWKEIEFKLFNAADVVHVVGSYEQEYLQEKLPNKPIRNIPLYIYDEPPKDIQKDFTLRNDILFVGGFGHPPNEDAVLWFAKDIYPLILKKYPDMVWHIVGGSVPDSVKALESKNIIVHGRVSDEELAKLYNECRLAVVPLRYGAGVKGKIVEAAYYQIPMVTTTIGAEGMSTAENTMIVEDDAEKMAEKINDLYEDFDTLKEMSDNGPVFIEKYFSQKAVDEVLALDMKA